MKRTLVMLTIILAALSTFGAQGMNVFHIGNSLTDETYGVNGIAMGFGYTNMKLGKYMIPGAPIHWLWSHDPKNASGGYDGFRLINGPEISSSDTWYTTTTAEQLRIFAYNAVVLQVYPRNGDGFDNPETVTGVRGFAGEAYKGNSKCQVYILPSHVDVDNDTCKTSELKTCYEPLAKSISDQYPSNPRALVIPIPQAWNAMYRAGYKDLLIPNDGHANCRGRYLNYCLLYAVIYKKNPAGAVLSKENIGFSSFKSSDDKGFSFNAAFAAKAQQIAWDEAQKYSWSGVAPVSVTQTTPRIHQQKTHNKRTIDLAGKTVTAPVHKNIRIITTE